MGEDQNLCLASGVVWAAVGDDFVVFLPASTRYISLNATAGVVLRVAERRGTLAEAVREVCAQFDVASSVAAADLAGVCADLSRFGVLVVGDPGQTGPAASS